MLDYLIDHAHDYAHDSHSWFKLFPCHLPPPIRFPSPGMQPLLLLKCKYNNIPQISVKSYCALIGNQQRR